MIKLLTSSVTQVVSYQSLHLEQLEHRWLLSGESSDVWGGGESPGNSDNGGIAARFQPPPMVVSPTNPVQAVRVIVLNFEPTVPSQDNRTLWQIFGWNDPRQLAADFINDLEYASGGAVDFQVAEWRDLNEFPIFTDGFRYTADQYVQNRINGSGWHDGSADFYAIAQQQGLAELANSHAIDEIWTFGDHFFSLFGEAWMAGPGAFFVNGPVYEQFPVDRAIAGYGFNYERGVAEMLHNLGHRTENHMSRTYGQTWNITNPSSAWDFYTANVAQSMASSFGVGSCHYPFNAASDYDYSNPRVLPSYADDFVLHFPNHSFATLPTSRDAWGDEGMGDWHRGYQKWFFGHIPRTDGVAADGRQNNWYKYLFDFNAFAPGSGSPRDNQAILGTPLITRQGVTSYEFTLRYYDLQGIDLAAIGTGDVRVTGPNAYDQLASVVSVGSEYRTTVGTARTVRYQITGPGGMWNLDDSGQYVVQLRAGEVRDLSGTFLPPADLGSFSYDPTPDGLIDIGSMLAGGQASVAATPWDIGGPTAIFDGQATSLYRSMNINPAAVTVSLNLPRTIEGFRTLVSHASGSPAYRWRVETANSLTDLNAGTGSYRLAVPFTETPSDTFLTATVTPAVTAMHIRLTVQRLTGDDYVHINEWQFLGAPTADNTVPVASLHLPPAVNANDTSSSFVVRYTDDVAIDIRTVNFGDARIEGPGGFVQPAALYGLDVNANGPQRDVTYFVSPPGGSWTHDDNGTYSILMRPNQVFDTAGREVSAGVLGTFTVNLPQPETRPRFDMTEMNAVDWLAWADGASASTIDDSTRVVRGLASVRFDTDGGFDTWIRYEPARGTTWNLNAITRFRGSVYAENPSPFGFQAEPLIRFVDLDGDAMEFRYFQNGSPYPLWNDARGQWLPIEIDVKNTAQPNTGWRGQAQGTPDWSRMRTVEVHADTWDQGFSMWFDRFGFNMPEDFNSDGNLDTQDINALVAEIARRNHAPSFDLNGDQLVDLLDLDAWLEYAGDANLGLGRVYLGGDANLDGFVDGFDFDLWNANKFTAVAAWSRGDFNADGFVDGSDFGIWNANKSTPSQRLTPILTGEMPRHSQNPCKRTSEMHIPFHRIGALQDRIFEEITALETLDRSRIKTGESSSVNRVDRAGNHRQ